MQARLLPLHQFTIPKVFDINCNISWTKFVWRDAKYILMIFFSSYQLHKQLILLFIRWPASLHFSMHDHNIFKRLTIFVPYYFIVQRYLILEKFYWKKCISKCDKENHFVQEWITKSLTIKNKFFTTVRSIKSFLCI